MPFPAIVFGLALLAGAMASVTGFGIGSVLTPVFSFQVTMKLAVVAAAFPHIAASAYRLWALRRAIDKGLLIRFGLPSAGGGLVGALLHSVVTSALLGYVFSLLLVLAGVTSVTQVGQQVRLGRRGAYAAGIVSGLLGGMVGSQGGIRGAALLGLKSEPAGFVAIMTATSLLIDVVRIPIYLWTSGHLLTPVWGWVALASLAACAGTVIGKSVLARIPEKAFRGSVATAITLIGVYMLYRAWSCPGA